MSDKHISSAEIAKKKGARAAVASYGPLTLVTVRANNREVGRFMFNKEGKLVRKLIIEKSFYPLELARVTFDALEAKKKIASTEQVTGISEVQYVPAAETINAPVDTVGEKRTKRRGRKLKKHDVVAE